MQTGEARILDLGHLVELAPRVIMMRGHVTVCRVAVCTGDRADKQGRSAPLREPGLHARQAVRGTAMLCLHTALARNGGRTRRACKNDLFPMRFVGGRLQKYYLNGVDAFRLKFWFKEPKLPSDGLQ